MDCNRQPSLEVKDTILYEARRVFVKVEAAKAHVLPQQESLESLVEANGLLLMNEETTTYKAGDLVDVMILERSNN